MAPFGLAPFVSGLKAQDCSLQGLSSFSNLKHELGPQLKKYLIRRYTLISLKSSLHLQKNCYRISNGKTFQWKKYQNNLCSVLV